MMSESEKIEQSGKSSGRATTKSPNFVYGRRAGLCEDFRPLRAEPNVVFWKHKNTGVTKPNFDEN